MTNHFSLEKKTALVTGGASGIGAAIVRRFLAAGVNVFSLDLTPTAPEGATAITGDVSDESIIVGAIAQAADASPTGHLDILVNNAAIQPLGTSFAELTPELLTRTFSTNVLSVALGIKHAPTRMPPTGGRIISTTSFVGTIGVPNGAAYATSKAAVSHLTRCGAIELASRGITVNAVAPGTVLTPAVTDIPNNPEIPFVSKRTPLGRLAEPHEIAVAYHFLASAEAAYLTGIILPVDGGITAGWDSYDLPPLDLGQTAHQSN
jgi:NAD(P)-dependent dehydrogenase (short-subunit alcohol dehydrogenase family)